MRFARNHKILKSRFGHSFLSHGHQFSEEKLKHKIIKNLRKNFSRRNKNNHYLFKNKYCRINKVILRWKLRKRKKNEIGVSMMKLFLLLFVWLFWINEKKSYSINILELNLISIHFLQLFIKKYCHNHSFMQFK